MWLLLQSNALAVTNASNASAGDTQQDSGGLSLHGLTLQSASSADAKGKQKQKVINAIIIITRTLCCAA